MRRLEDSNSGQPRIAGCARGFGTCGRPAAHGIFLGQIPGAGSCAFACPACRRGALTAAADLHGDARTGSDSIMRRIEREFVQLPGRRQPGDLHPASDRPRPHLADPASSRSPGIRSGSRPRFSAAAMISLRAFSMPARCNRVVAWGRGIFWPGGCGAQIHPIDDFGYAVVFEAAFSGGQGAWTGLHPAASRRKRTWHAPPDVDRMPHAYVFSPALERRAQSDARRRPARTARRSRQGCNRRFN